MIDIGKILLTLWNDSCFSAIFASFQEGGWQNLVMLAIGCVLLYLAIVKKFEPLLLCGIAFGCILSNLPGANLYNQELWTNFMDANHEAYHSYGTIISNILFKVNACHGHFFVFYDLFFVKRKNILEMLLKIVYN